MDKETNLLLYNFPLCIYVFYIHINFFKMVLFIF